MTRILTLVALAVYVVVGSACSSGSERISPESVSEAPQSQGWAACRACGLSAAVNWTPGGDIAPNTFQVAGAAMDPVTSFFWVVGTDVNVAVLAPVIRFTENGLDWHTDVGYVGTGYPTGVAFSNTGAALVTTAAQFNVMRWQWRHAGGAWATVSVVGLHSSGVEWSALENRFNTFGGDGSQFPKIWSMVGNAVTANSMPNASAYGVGAVLMMATPTVATARKVAFASVSTGWRQWDAAVGSVFWTDRGPLAFASAPVALAWNAPHSMFVAACDGGEVYKSSDGIAWSMVAAAPIAFASLAVMNGALVGYGDGVAANAIAASVDDGATWYTVGSPLGRDIDGKVYAADGRFALIQTLGGRTALSSR